MAPPCVRHRCCMLLGDFELVLGKLIVAPNTDAKCIFSLFITWYKLLELVLCEMTMTGRVIGLLLGRASVVGRADRHYS